MFEQILVWWPDWAFATLCSVLVSALGTSLYVVLEWAGLSPVPVGHRKGPEEEKLDDLSSRLKEEYKKLSSRLRQFANRYGEKRPGVAGRILGGRKRARARGTSAGPVCIGPRGQIGMGWQLLLDMLASAPAAHKDTCSEHLGKLISDLERIGYLDAREAEEWRERVRTVANGDGQPLPDDMWTVGMWGKEEHSLEKLFLAVAQKIEDLAVCDRHALSGAAATSSPQPSAQQQGSGTARIPDLYDRIEDLVPRLEELKDEALGSAAAVLMQRSNAAAGLSKAPFATLDSYEPYESLHAKE